jgi:GMP synthase (glutamine-hydrolysing)
VAFALCQRALGPERVRGVYVDTGLMREGETDYVRRMPGLSVEHGEAQFLGALAGVCDPERKRHIIGEEFVRVQERIIESRHLLDDRWILGQGTIYPGHHRIRRHAKSRVIKTHHNRVPGIQKLIEAGRLVEPLRTFYKDEVREIGRELGLPAEVLDRHPFPGPGLAIRCLCAEHEAGVEATPEGYVLPLRSVGVQGDSRSYAHVLSIDSLDQARASELINRIAGVNRAIACVEAALPVSAMRVRASSLTPERLARLRRADAIVRRLSHESGFDRQYLAVPGGV